MLTYERFTFQSLSQRTNANYTLENYLAMMPNGIPHISIILPVYHERRICNRGKNICIMDPISHIHARISCS